MCTGIKDYLLRSPSEQGAVRERERGGEGERERGHARINEL